MDKKIILGVIALVVASIAILLSLPSDSHDTPDTLPWRIAHPTPETSRVFGITLGKTSLGETEKFFKEQTEVSLFKTTDGKMLMEAFFDELNFNGLKAKFAFTIAVPKEELDGMFQRGLRMNSTASGKRITLAPDDLTRVRQTPVSSVTYLPSVKLEEDIISKRFGAPTERIRETKSGAVHWLYPQHGLDVTLGGSEKPLFQYVSPKDFDLLRVPLLTQGEVLK
jgi:hypothetical protein